MSEGIGQQDQQQGVYTPSMQTLAEQHTALQKVEKQLAEKWDHYDRILVILTRNRSGDWGWGRNGRCKYITLTIDTRGYSVQIKDRDGESITIEELENQYTFPPEKQKKGWRIRQWFGSKAK